MRRPVEGHSPRTSPGVTGAASTFSWGVGMVAKIAKEEEEEERL